MRTRNTRTLVIVCIFVIVIGGLFLFLKQPTQENVIASTTYTCDGGKTIQATYYAGPSTPQPKPGEPPTPMGSVVVSLDGGANMTLQQTISASGIRYANADESFVFWSKGDQALVMRNNTMDLTHTNCSAHYMSFDDKNATFTVSGKSVTLVDGVSDVPAAPGSASRIVTRYFGNEATGDLNGDGLQDAAFLITQETGGSGVFYYVVAAIHSSSGYKTTNAFFIGDRIAPQSTEIHSDSGELHVNFATRNPGEPMTAQPSHGAVLVLKVTSDGKLTGLMK